MNDSSESSSNPNNLDVFPLFKSANHQSEGDQQALPIDESKEIVEKPKKFKQTRQTNTSESNPFQCTICSIAVSSQIVYEEHIKGRKHQTQLQEILLKNPDYKTLTFEELLAKNPSKKSVHNQSDRVKHTVISSNEFVCDICRVKCNSKKKFDLHIAGKRHQMNLRDRAFAKLDESSNSMSMYTCNVCSYRCTTAKELKKHRLKSHSMRKNNEADRCDEAERKKQINFDDYRIPITYSKSNRFQYECKICQRKFREKIHVLGHIASAYHIEQVSQIQKDSLPQTANNPFFTSKKRSYSSENTYYPPMNNPTMDSYDQIQSKRPRIYYNPDYEEMPTDYSWNNNNNNRQYYSGSWQYCNQTSNYNQSKQTFLPNYDTSKFSFSDSLPSSYSTYPY